MGVPGQADHGGQVGGEGVMVVRTGPAGKAQQSRAWPQLDRRVSSPSLPGRRS